MLQEERSCVQSFIAWPLLLAVLCERRDGSPDTLAASLPGGSAKPPHFRGLQVHAGTT